MAELYENYITGDDFAYAPFGNRRAAQTFTPSISHEVTSVKLKLLRYGYPGTLTVSIKATTGLVPSGADLSSGTIDGDTLSTSGYEWVSIPQTSYPSLTAGTKYAIVIKAPLGDYSNYVAVAGDSSSPTYTGGNYCYSSDSGANWTAFTSADLVFEEWGLPVVPPIEIEGSSAGASSATGKIIYNKASSLAGASASASSATGAIAISGQVLIAAASASVSSAAGVVVVARSVASSSASVSTVTGIIGITTEIYLRGAASSVSAVTGTLVVQLLADGGTIRMIPFIYSSQIAYMCEFGKEYIRFFYTDADSGAQPLLDALDAHVEVVTPYSEDDLYELQTEQIADTMWIVHPDHEPRKLTRTSATEFSLDEITFTKGPFLLRNDLDEAEDDTITITASVTEKDEAGTLTATDAIFESDHAGGLLKLVHPDVNRKTHGSKIPETTGIIGEAIKTFGDFTFKITTTGWAGTVNLEKSVDDFVTTATVKQYSTGIRTFEGTELIEDTDISQP